MQRLALAQKEQIKTNANNKAAPGNGEGWTESDAFNFGSSMGAPGFATGGMGSAMGVAGALTRTNELLTEIRDSSTVSPAVL